MHETAGARFAAEDYQNIKTAVRYTEILEGYRQSKLLFTGCLLKNIIHKAAFEQKD